MKRLRPSLRRLHRYRLRLIYLYVKILLALEWFEQLTGPAPVNIPKFIFTYSLSLGVTLVLYAPPVVRLPELVILWAFSWILAMSVYQIIPGR